MKNAPQPPFLPFALEQNNINAQREAQKVVEQIADDFQNPNLMPKAETLTKFNVLTRLIRIMSQKDIYNTAQKYYISDDATDPHSSSSAKRSAAWKAFRDAVAEAGTPASFATIAQWIQENKVRENEAASLIATQVRSIRYPTEEVMNAFYDLATSESVQKQSYLNATALQSLASFLRQSQVSNHSAYSFYPSHAFGRLASKKYRIVQRKVIPYLAHKMNIASQNEDSEKMLSYIRALGNLGHPAILNVLEPYLEGKMPTSEFQRLAIVVAMDRLVELYPKVARSVLYKVYQNTADRDEVRVAAVFLLMRTNPPASMLQRIAGMTNVEKSQNVASAVKSALLYAAELDHEDDRELSENAQAAYRLLDSQEPAAQDSRTFLYDYIMEELNLAYKMQASWIGSDNNLAPKAAFLRMKKDMGGYQNNYNQYQVMISNVNQLFSMLSNRMRSTGSSKNKENKQQKNQPYHNKKYNFEKIEKLLDIQAEQVEELEAQILMKIANTQRFYAFNNESLENFPQKVRHAARALEKGQHFNATKWFNQEQITIAFPLASGLPFLFTYKTPTLMRAGGEIHVQTKPSLAQGSDDEIRVPKSIDASAEVDVLYTTQIDARVGFLTLFDHQRYVAAVQKKIQVRLPLRMSVSINSETDDVSVQVEPLEQKNDITLIYASSLPYTQRRHIEAAYDDTKESDTKTIHINEQRVYDQHFGQSSAGLVFHVNAKYEKDFINYADVMEYLRRNDFVSLFMYTFATESNEYFNLKIELDNQKSEFRSVHASFQFSSQNSWEDSESKPKHPKDTSNPKNLAHPTNTDANSKARREQFMQNAAAGIYNAKVNAIDASISFNSKQQKISQYIATIAFANSQSNNQQRLLAYFSSNPAKDSKRQMCFHAEQEMPNVPQLNFKNALIPQEDGDMRIELDFGDKCNNGQHITIKTKMSQSQEYLKYVEESAEGQQCKQQMKLGDYQMPACENATYQANLYDQYIITANYDGLSSNIKQAAYQAYTYLRHYGFDYVHEDIFTADNKNKQLKARITFAPNMERVNVSLDTPFVSTEWRNYPLNDYTQRLPVHPDYDVFDRLAQEVTNDQYEGKYEDSDLKSYIITFFFQQLVSLTRTMLTLSITILINTMSVTAGMSLS